MRKLLELFKAIVGSGSNFLGDTTGFDGNYRYKFQLQSKPTKQTDYTTRKKPSKRRRRRLRGKTFSRMNTVTEFNGDHAPTVKIFNKIPADWNNCHVNDLSACDGVMCIDCVAFKRNKNHRAFMEFLGMM